MKKFFKGCFFTLPCLCVLIGLWRALSYTMSGEEVSKIFEYLAVGVYIPSVLITLGQIVYLMIHVIKNEKFSSNQKAVWLVLIYMLNVFSIPCYAYKYLLKDKNYKIKSTIYIILSVVLISLTLFSYVSGIINIIKESSINVERSLDQYVTKDGIVEISAHSGYIEKNVGQYDLYLRDEQTQITTGIFTYDLELPAYSGMQEEEIINTQVDYFKNTRKQFELYNDKKVNTLYDKTIAYLEYVGKTETSDECVYRFSTIKFNEKDNYIVFVIQVLLKEDYRKYSAELMDILNSAELR